MSKRVRIHFNGKHISGIEVSPGELEVDYELASRGWVRLAHSRRVVPASLLQSHEDAAGLKECNFRLTFDEGEFVEEEDGTYSYYQRSEVCFEYLTVKEVQTYQQREVEGPQPEELEKRRKNLALAQEYAFQRMAEGKLGWLFGAAETRPALQTKKCWCAGYEHDLGMGCW